MKAKKRPRMSASEAVQFGRRSNLNAAIIESSLSCGCEAYKDTYTFNRWRAQGFGVRKGEHGIAIHVVSEVERDHEDDEAVVHRSDEARRTCSVVIR